MSDLFKVNAKSTRMTAKEVFTKVVNGRKHFSAASIVNFQQVNDSWVSLGKSTN